MRVTVLSGRPRQRGLQHGESLRDQILQLARRVLDDGCERSGLSTQDYLARLVHRSGFVAHAKTRTPALVAELEGIARGAGLPVELAWLLNLGDEQWAVKTADNRCTSVGLRDASGTVVGQNMDLPLIYAEEQVLLCWTDGVGREHRVLTFPGCLGLMGATFPGCVVCCTTLRQLRTDRKGLPVALVLRGALERATTADVATWLRSVAHASGQSYMVADSLGVQCFECSTSQVWECAPDALRGGLWHTNHPLVSDDRPGEREQPPDLGPLAVLADNSQVRAQSVQNRLVAPGLATAVVREVLRAQDDPRHPVSRPAALGEALTFASVVVELGHERSQFWASDGPPSENPYELFLDFKELVR